MMRRIPTLVLFTLLVGTGVRVGQWHGKSTGGEGVDGEVAVIAKRRAQSIYDVAAAISVIGPDDVDRQSLGHTW